ncbi:hypothetical protein AGIG_G18964 [Arapaima gigas]
MTSKLSVSRKIRESSGTSELLALKVTSAGLHSEHHRGTPASRWGCTLNRCTGSHAPHCSQVHLTDLLALVEDVMAHTRQVERLQLQVRAPLSLCLCVQPEEGAAL